MNLSNISFWMNMYEASKYEERISLINKQSIRELRYHKLSIWIKERIINHEH